MNAKANVGGQAVIEGVMMRGADKVAVAVRQPSGEIVVDVNPVQSIGDRHPILKKPLLRGVVALIESLVMGLKALSYSAQMAGEEDEQLDSKEMALTMVVSVVLAILVFVVIPTWSIKFLSGVLDQYAGSEPGGRRAAPGHLFRLYRRYQFHERYSTGVPVSRRGA
jgi:uncharacterized protein YqhQ